MAKKDENPVLVKWNVKIKNGVCVIHGNFYHPILIRSITPITRSRAAWHTQPPYLCRDSSTFHCSSRPSMHGGHNRNFRTRTQCIIWFTVSMAEMKLKIWQGKYKSWTAASELKGCFCTFNAPSEGVTIRCSSTYLFPFPISTRGLTNTMLKQYRTRVAWRRGDLVGAQGTLPAGLPLVNWWMMKRDVTEERN